MWWNIWIFFRRLKNGNIFDAPTVGRLMTAGKWKLAEVIISCVMWAIFSSDGSYPWWSGHQIYGYLDQISRLWTPLMIIFVAWLLREGQNLEEEQELTV